MSYPGDNQNSAINWPHLNQQQVQQPFYSTTVPPPVGSDFLANYPPPTQVPYPSAAYPPPPIGTSQYAIPPQTLVYNNTHITNYNAYPPVAMSMPPPQTNYAPQFPASAAQFSTPPPAVNLSHFQVPYPPGTEPYSLVKRETSSPESSYSHERKRSRSHSRSRSPRRRKRSRSRSPHHHSRSYSRYRSRSRSRSRERHRRSSAHRDQDMKSERRSMSSHRSSRSMSRRSSPSSSCRDEPCRKEERKMWDDEVWRRDKEWIRKEEEVWKKDKEWKKEKEWLRREEDRRRDEERRRGDRYSSRRPQSRERSLRAPSSTPSTSSQRPSAIAEQKQMEQTKREEKDLIESACVSRWTRSTPSDLFYSREAGALMRGTERLRDLCNQFDQELLQRAIDAREGKPKYEPPPNRHKPHLHKCKGTEHGSSSSNNSSCSEESSSEDEEDCSMRELERKRLHPDRLHQELWFNDPGEMNDGPLCRCSVRARRSGIRHGIYAGESHLPPCDPMSNNEGRLHHYRITISPPTNFLTKLPTIICYDQHEFIFEGFSMFSHLPLAHLPTCKVIRFNIQYTILYVEEKAPENFTIKELDLFFDYVFRELLELIDLDLKAAGDTAGCPRFHFMPRFVRELPDNGIEILSMNEVLTYLLAQNKPLVEEEALASLLKMPQFEWQNLADEVKGMLVTYPGMKPCSLRVDQIDREQRDSDYIMYPEIVHFGIRPPQLSYAGNPDYQREWREYVKLRHLLANMPKPSFEDKRRLEGKENKLQEMRMQSRLKRDVTVAISAQGFYRTGIMCDVIQHAMLIPVLVCHLRFHQSLDHLEGVIDYKFKNRYLLQLALTHPSYRENFGTNPDHARNSLTNCGIRQPEYGDRRIHYLHTRKRGINTLINIMSRFGKKSETESNITHNERLEFLGDAVVEFLSSIHLFFMFPDLEEGGLATYRAAIVQNQHLAVLAKTLNLEQYMLYAHGSDLCHDLELRHAMANCFEALMGALFLDGGIDVADKVFGETFFKGEGELLEVWVNYPKHPLQEQEPNGDRHWITQFPLLEKLQEFEESIGVPFTHIRLLARAFTDRSIGYNNLTLGSNQRLEFLGDTVLQLIASDYLYKHFPEHHEGHLSLLRSSLVNNRTQAVVCDDLGMTSYALYSNPKAELKTKDRADLLEALLGALYVDKDMEYCQTFCNVCFFPRLQDFIMNQDWNDPKSKLQQCCLTLRTMDGGEPDIPIYKVIECKGPTNTRIYTVAVYFRGERLATATGHSIQQAEMNAAKSALNHSEALFPQLNHQKRVIAMSMRKQQRPQQYRMERSPSRLSDSSHYSSTRPQQYRSDRSPSRMSDSSRSSICVRSERRLNHDVSPERYRVTKSQDKTKKSINVKKKHKSCCHKKSCSSPKQESNDNVVASKAEVRIVKIVSEGNDGDVSGPRLVIDDYFDDNVDTSKAEVRMVKIVSEENDGNISGSRLVIDDYFEQDVEKSEFTIDMSDVSPSAESL